MLRKYLFLLNFLSVILYITPVFGYNFQPVSLPLKDTYGNLLFSPDGTKVIDGLGQVYDANNGLMVFKVDYKTDFIMKGAIFSPDNKRIAAIWADGKAKVFSADNGALLFGLGDTAADAHLRKVGSVLAIDIEYYKNLFGSADRPADIYKEIYFSPDGQKIGIYLNDSTAKFFDATNGAFLFSIGSPSDAIVNSKKGTYSFLDKKIKPFIISPDNTKIGANFSSGVVRFFDADKGTLIFAIGSKDKPAYPVTFSNDGLIIGTDANEFFDARDGTSLFTLEDNVSYYFSADGKRIICVNPLGKQERNIKVLSAKDKSLLSEINIKEAPWGVVFSPDDTKFAIRTTIKNQNLQDIIKIFDIESGKDLFDLHTFEHYYESPSKPTKLITKNTPATIKTFSFTPDGQKIIARIFDNFAYGGYPEEKDISIFDSSNGDFLYSLGDVGYPVISSDSKKAITERKGQVRVWLFPPDQLIKAGDPQLIEYTDMIKKFKDSKVKDKTYDNYIIFIDETLGLKDASKTKQTEESVFNALDVHTQSYIRQLIPGRPNTF